MASYPVSGEVGGQNTAAKSITKEEINQNQFETLGKTVLDLNDRFDALTGFLGISITRSYKKFDVGDSRGLGQDTVACEPKPQKRGLFSFLRKK